MSHFLHKKTGNHVFFNGFPVIFSVYERARSSCGRPGGAGAPTEPAGETEPFEARRAIRKIRLNVHERARCVQWTHVSRRPERSGDRTSDLPLRSSPEFCLARYQKLSKILCFRAFWMVQIACGYHCFHLIPSRCMPSLLHPCCKARKFSRTSSVSISTI